MIYKIINEIEIMRKILVGIALALLLVPLSMACSARIEGLNFQPKEVYKGEPVKISGRVIFYVSGTDRDWYSGYGTVPSCRFLVEGGIIPQGYPLAIQLGITPSQPIQCCPGNDNFQAKYVTVTCEPWEQFGCKKEIYVTLEPLAPKEGFCDHCAGEGENRNPTCAEDPNFYWKGPGYYVGYLGVFKGCYYDLVSKGEEQEFYDVRKFWLNVKEKEVAPPTPPTPQPEQPWWSKQVAGPITTADLLLILAVVFLIVWALKR